MKSYLRIADFLDPAANRRILDWALDHRDDFVSTRVEEPHGGAPLRSSVGLNDLGPCRAIIRDAVAERLPGFAAELGLSSYELSRFDAELVAHNDGAYYKPHIDIGRGGADSRSRLISAVYYFNREPKRFSGGHLRIFPITAGAQAEPVDLEPENNLLLVFGAMTPHEVRPVACPSRRFEDSRFAINIWAHRVREI